MNELITMKEYYASKFKILKMAGIFSLIVFVFIITDFSNSKVSIYLAMLFLMVVAITGIAIISFFLIKRVISPVLTINNYEITIINNFLEKKEIQNLKKNDLIISDSEVIFREKDKEDIVLYAEDFSKIVFGTLLKDLESLPFNKIIK